MTFNVFLFIVDVTSNALHPGFVDTEIFGKSSSFLISFVKWLGVARMVAKVSITIVTSFCFAQGFDSFEG